MKVVEKQIFNIVRDAVCDFSEESPDEWMPTDVCFDECAKGDWCKKNIPLITGKIMSVFNEELKGGIPS